MAKRKNPEPQWKAIAGSLSAKEKESFFAMVNAIADGIVKKKREIVDITDNDRRRRILKENLFMCADHALTSRNYRRGTAVRKTMRTALLSYFGDEGADESYFCQHQGELAFPDHP